MSGLDIPLQIFVSTYCYFRKMQSNQETIKIPIQVTDLNSKNVLHKIVELGQEDGFFLCDISDIIEKFHKWKTAMPRVKPFYGRLALNSFLEIKIRLQNNFLIY